MMKMLNTLIVIKLISIEKMSVTMSSHYQCGRRGCDEMFR
jgi:hypothetical protein